MKQATGEVDRGNVPFKSQLKYDCTYPRRPMAHSAKGYKWAHVCVGVLRGCHQGCTIFPTVQLPKRLKKKRKKKVGNKEFLSVIFSCNSLIKGCNSPTHSMVISNTGNQEWL